MSDVYIVDGSRTPFLKARSGPGAFSAADLAVFAGKNLLLRQPFVPSKIDEVITGCVMPSADEANISRIIALRLGCGDDVPAWTVQRNCASGLQALDSAWQAIKLGRSHIVLAGGTEAMSRAPLLFDMKMAAWLGQWYQARHLTQKLKTLTHFKLRYLAPIISLLRGLTDPVVGLSMGQTAENLAYQFAISRQQMDEFAFNSHQRAANAQRQQLLPEITPIYDVNAKVYTNDDGVRADTSLEKLETLKPIFDRQYGMVTAANSSQVTDGAAYLLLASKKAVTQYHLPVLAKIIDIQWSALSPANMGLGPAHAVAALLKKHKLKLTDIDYMELNEAFAAQVLACLAAWQNKAYCKSHLHSQQALGEYPLDKLNIDGGAIAVGHPVGASGARIALHLVHVLKRQQSTRGIASLCIGGGQGGAMLIEQVDEV
ncbi:MAG: acetyl-CoA C-acetyltransferase [Gammaproteobacteria bacterium]